ncbi:hypothetical protein [Evansella halocellulosilytica]|uniref:hypothetical protein n=1 Tax=Evansella halocellulosilytica TaxID=2011013 RepID=UPI0015CD1142|nr:hypothetical protein [Evansella halocellulosilytica]
MDKNVEHIWKKPNFIKLFISQMFAGIMYLLSALIAFHQKDLRDYQIHHNQKSNKMFG